MSNDPIAATDPNETRRRVRCNATGDLLVELVNPTGESQTDDVTGALVTIDTVHHEIHEGELYSVTYKTPDASPLADNAAMVLAIHTGARYCHLIAGGAMGGDAEGEFYEDCNVTGGTAMDERNHNRPRAAGHQATAAVFRDPVINDVGNLLEHAFMPGGSGPFAPGGSASQRNEWVLQPNSWYMARITNRSGGAQPGSIGIAWYEEGDN